VDTRQTERRKREKGKRDRLLIRLKFNSNIYVFRNVNVFLSAWAVSLPPPSVYANLDSLFMVAKAPFSYRFFSILMNQFRSDGAKENTEKVKQKHSNNLNTAQFAYYQMFNIRLALFCCFRLLAEVKILNDFFRYLIGGGKKVFLKTIAVLFSFIALIVSVGSLVPY
jgi:hypothetical protein